MTSIDPIRARDFAKQVVQRLQKAGFEAYWAGGCVRDALLGLPPKDYDVATGARPDQVRDLFGPRRTLAIGAAFGVISVLGPREAGQVEVATFRRDAQYSDGRHPDSVSFSNARDDALRRDFTINGMFFDPLAEQLIDFVGGEADVRARRIVAIGNPYDRISEDKLRMLRAVRFAATFDFEIDEDTAESIRQRADDIRVVSAERISNELQRMLVSDARGRAVRLLVETKLLPAILPELADAMADARTWSSTTDVLEQLQDADFETAFAALLLPAGAQAEEICQRLRLSNPQTRTVVWLLKNLTPVRSANQRPWPRIQPLLVHADTEKLMQLLRAVGPQSDDGLEQFKWCQEKLQLPAGQLNPPPLLDGSDLKRIGIQPGPIFKRLLGAVRDAQLKGEIASRHEAELLAQDLRGEEDTE